MIDLRVGDCREVLRSLEPRSVQCVVTSPPYFGLRDYGVDGQMGLEPTMAEYIAGMVDVFRLVRDVLADDGTLWLNIGDSYASSGGIHTSGSYGGELGRAMSGVDRSARIASGLKPKDLMMVPARLAIALQDDGWYLRSDIIWHKPNPMPESVTGRPTSAHEHIFLLTKSARYFYDADAIREPASETTVARWGDRLTDRVNPRSSAPDRNDFAFAIGEQSLGVPANGRNCRNVWTIATQPYSGAHFAVFPTEIPRRCILAGTSERGQCLSCGKPWVRVTVNGETTGRTAVNGMGNGELGKGVRFGDAHSATIGWQPSCVCDAGDPVPQTVLDPFAGAGTTLLVADRLGRNAVGIELNQEYADLARGRITNDSPMFAQFAEVAP